MVYKTYQEANIAHPYCDIYVSIDGKFAPDLYVAHIALCGIKEGWNKYQPQTNEFNTDSIAVTEQEEEEFNVMANSSEIPNSSEWKNGDECVYMNHKVIQKFVGFCPKREGYCYIQAPTFEINFVEVSKLSKPETQEEREERERLEAIEDMANYLNNLSPHCKEKMEYVTRGS